MPTPEDEIRRAEDLWVDIKGRQKRYLDEWLTIGRGLVNLSLRAMEKSNSKSPFGKGYQAVLTQEIRATRLGDMDPAMRSNLRALAEHEPEVIEWHQGLPDAEKARYGHPSNIWKAFRKLLKDDAASRGFPSRRPEPKTKTEHEPNSIEEVDEIIRAGNRPSHHAKLGSDARANVREIVTIIDGLGLHDDDRRILLNDMGDGLQNAADAGEVDDG